ncbi:MAG TPA: energy transducer TonB, partial [Terriglobales bacterium]|nr:energy transducer TonB [Terriglobales bacterium]
MAGVLQGRLNKAEEFSRPYGPATGFIANLGVYFPSNTIRATIFGNMLAPLATPPRRRLGWLTSAAIHGALLACLLYHPPAIFISPRFAAHGTGGSTQTVYLTASNDYSVAPKSSERTMRLTAPSAAPVVRITRLSKKESGGRSLHPAHAANTGGSTYGSMMEGSVGTEVRPALPEVFPDPDVDRASLPPSVQGDVIVEITIDERGNVTEERLLTGVDHGVDDKVIAALKNWHFRPATSDGVPIPSKQDV